MVLLGLLFFVVESLDFRLIIAIAALWRGVREQENMENEQNMKQDNCKAITILIVAVLIIIAGVVTMIVEGPHSATQCVIEYCLIFCVETSHDPTCCDPSGGCHNNRLMPFKKHWLGSGIGNGTCYSCNASYIYIGLVVLIVGLILLCVAGCAYGDCCGSNQPLTTGGVTMVVQQPVMMQPAMMMPSIQPQVVTQMPVANPVCSSEQQISVEAPEGAVPGQTVQIETEKGLMNVTIPDGVTGGMCFPVVI